MSGTCCIVGAGDNSGTKLNVPQGAFIIAADGGLNALEAAGLVPDLIIGDFDSLGKTPEGENVIVLPAEKDDTDSMVSVKMALDLGYDTLIIYGGLGGRLDHSIANLQALLFISHHGARAFLVGCGWVCTVITDGSLKLSPKTAGTVSVFSLEALSHGVTIDGLKYGLCNHTLSNDMPLGVSNEFVGLPSRISVEKGSLLVICQDDSFTLGSYLG